METNMSLGFNPNRPVRTTNLPGAVGGSVVSVTSVRRRVRSPMVSTPRRNAPNTTTTVVVTPSATTRRVQIQAEERQDESSKVTTSQLYEEMQWVYADVKTPLIDADTNESIGIDVGTRVLMVYPMQSDKDTGKVRMRLKSVHPATGQLSMRWVIAYDPEKETRFLTRFSLVT